jgi:hypothetical protein
MGKSMSPTDERLYRMCDEALHYLWDPIGVAWAPQARDEYYSYLPPVFRLVKAGHRAELIEYLREVEEVRMGGGTTPPTSRERVADFLLEARDWIEEVSPEDVGHVTLRSAD